MVWVALGMNALGIGAALVTLLFATLGEGLFHLGFMLGGMILMVIGGISLLVAIANAAVNFAMLFDPASRRDVLFAIDGTLCLLLSAYWLAVLFWLYNR